MIQPIVEGAGEVEAVPLLLRRLNAEFGVANALIGRPIRQRREQLMKREGIERAIELARRQAGCRAVFILLDADDLCPRTEAPPLQTQAHELARQFPCPLVLANREYEAWFLASQENLGA